ncbi:MAG: TraB/GumN family protein, partial [Vicinamibacterales bacterium]
MTRRRLTRAVVVFPVLAGILCATSPALRAAEPSFLWRVSRGTGTFYLAGSVHMLTAEHYPVSPALDSAFAESDLLVEEVDYREMMAPEAQMQMLSRGMFPADGSLKGSVSAETYDLVSRRLAGVGLSIQLLDRFKPWLVALTLLGMEWQRAGFDQRLGLDRHFYDRAIAAGMPVQALETIEYQISRFDGMTDAEQDQMLASTLKIG